jgi:hypothetical protein
MGRHLTPDRLMEFAEGAGREADRQHLASCTGCRSEVAAARDALRAAAAVQVPEPSPLFWDHFSARVREAIATVPAPRRRWWTPIVPRPRAAWTAGIVAAIVAIALAVTLRAPQPDERMPSATGAVSPAASRSAQGDDPSFAFVAEVSAGYDWDAAAAAGLTPRLGAADRAVDDLSGPELRELQRLLKAETP